MADSFVNTAVTGYALGNSIPGTWTQTYNGFQGGTISAPVFLLAGSPVGGVNGTIGSEQEYYSFLWAGGAFSATASVTGASGDASYLFSEGALGNCSGLGQITLNTSDSFTGTISLGNLAPGQYCIGLDPNSAADPDFALTFNTPLTAAPETATFVLLCVGLGAIGVVSRRRAR